MITYCWKVVGKEGCTTLVLWWLTTCLIRLWLAYDLWHWKISINMVMVYMWWYKCPPLFENIRLGSLKSLFQLNNQVNVNVFLLETTPFSYYRELRCLIPCRCTFGPISPLASWTLQSTLFCWSGEKRKEKEWSIMIRVCNYKLWDNSKHPGE